MNISPELWDIAKMLLGGYVVFVMQRSDRTQMEIFRRVRALELNCARNHGLVGVPLNENT